MSHKRGLGPEFWPGVLSVVVALVLLMAHVLMRKSGEKK